MSKTVHPEGEFNKDLFMELLLKAKGPRSQTQFAADCGLSTAYVCKLMNGRIKQVPIPSTIKKIADCAFGSVSAKEMLTAAGYNADKYIVSTDLTEKQCIAALTSALANLPYNWKINQQSQSLSSLCISLTDCPISQWCFYIIKDAAPDFTSDRLYHYFGKMTASYVKPVRKFSLVTTSEQIYDQVILQPPFLLSATFSVVLIDQNTLSVLKEDVLRSAADSSAVIPLI